MSERKQPYRHPVGSYNRDNGTFVTAYWRGQGLPLYKAHRVVRQNVPVVPIYSPITADVIDPKIIGYDYDREEKASRPVSFQATLITADDPRGYDKDEWIQALLPVFSNLDNTLRNGYVTDTLSLNRDPYAWDKWVLSLRLKRGGREIDTEDVDSERMEKLVRATRGAQIATPTETEYTEPVE